MSRLSKLPFTKSSFVSLVPPVFLLLINMPFLLQNFCFQFWCDIAFSFAQNGQQITATRSSLLGSSRNPRQVFFDFIHALLVVLCHDLACYPCSDEVFVSRPSSGFKTHFVFGEEQEQPIPLEYPYPLLPELEEVCLLVPCFRWISRMIVWFFRMKTNPRINENPLILRCKRSLLILSLSNGKLSEIARFPSLFSSLPFSSVAACSTS
jgi:hypothetical protein